MPDTKTYILDDLPTDHDALDFTPYVETLMDVCSAWRMVNYEIQRRHATNFQEILQSDLLVIVYF